MVNLLGWTSVKEVGKVGSDAQSICQCWSWCGHRASWSQESIVPL